MLKMYLDLCHFNTNPYLECFAPTYIIQYRIIRHRVIHPTSFCISLETEVPILSIGKNIRLSNLFFSFPLKGRKIRFLLYCSSNYKLLVAKKLVIETLVAAVTFTTPNISILQLRYYKSAWQKPIELRAINEKLLKLTR